MKNTMKKIESLQTVSNYLPIKSHIRKTKKLSDSFGLPKELSRSPISDVYQLI